MEHAASRRHRPCTIVPPYLLQRLEQHPDPAVRECARTTLTTDSALRAAGRLPMSSGRPLATASLPAAPNRRVFDAQNTRQLPGVPARSEGDAESMDVAVNEAYDGLGATWSLLHDVYGRNSLDGQGLRMLATVHYGERYANAFWDGERMVFGDGDGEIFTSFTAAVDIIAHELAHGVTEMAAGFRYQGQSGALNEHVSDVIGSLVKQRLLGQPAQVADWLIGAGLFTPAVRGEALRSLKAPGSAYDDDVLGRDPQPATMADYVQTTDDNGGVHINSGIPNHAFYLAATTIGGYAWEHAGQVWFDVLTGDYLRSDADFAAFAEATIAAATARYGSAAAQTAAITTAWHQVGVLGDSVQPPAPGEAQPPRAAAEPVEDLVGQVYIPQAELDAVARSMVRLSRSGGFAGLNKYASFRPLDLGSPDGEEWTSLLSTDSLTRFSSVNSTPDGLSYKVRVVDQHVDFTLAEPTLPGEVLALLERTLDRPELGRSNGAGAGE